MNNRTVKPIAEATAAGLVGQESAVATYAAAPTAAAVATPAAGLALALGRTPHGQSSSLVQLPAPQ